ACYASCAPHDLHSFPTRRSSDLGSGEPELITASLCNSEFDTAILIATGTPGDLTWVAGNDDAGINGPCGSNTTRSYVQFNSDGRSEEHTSELQSRENLVCRLLLE